MLHTHFTRTMDCCRLALLFWCLFALTAAPTHAQQAATSEIDQINQQSFELRNTDRRSAMELAQQALRLSEGKYTAGTMNAYLNLGIHYAILNRVDSSQYYLVRTGDFFEEDLFKSGLLHYYQGQNASFLRDFKRANKQLNLADSLFEKAGSFQYLAEVQNSLGIVQGRQGNREKALSFFSKAYEIKLANDLDTDKELTNIAIVYRMLKQYDKALEFARKSLAISTQINDSLGMVQTLITIGNIHSGAQDFDSAAYHYDQALEMALKNGYTKQATSSLQNKSVAAERSGELREATALLRRVIDISTEEDHMWERAYFELARIFRKQNLLDSSIYYARQSYQLSRTYDDPDMASQGAKLLSRNFRSLNQPDSALLYLNHYIVHEDTLNARNNNLRWGDFRVRIETLEQENQINRLNQEKQLEQLRNNWLIAVIIIILVMGLAIIYALLRQHRNRIKINKLEQEKLQGEIDHAQGELSQQTLHMIHVNNCLNEIESQVKSAKDKSSESSMELAQVLSSIQVNKSLGKDWENFNKYFGRIHADFVETLQASTYGLSNHEQRVCALLRLGLSNREVSTILNIQPKSVTMLRYRIKKKLQLDKDQDLEAYLKQL